jgi:hypothetical protein
MDIFIEFYIYVSYVDSHYKIYMCYFISTNVLKKHES